uniref:Uncharacterized protein n=1 Tax=Parascaris univalens TaxID=6257 RepID=A0A915CK72_PARUN
MSILYPFEVSEEERETLPITKSREFVKHLANQNLQVEETEEKEESRTKPETHRTRYLERIKRIVKEYPNSSGEVMETVELEETAKLILALARAHLINKTN